MTRKPLTSKGAERLREELKALQEALQLPLLLITHDDDDVRCLAEEVVCLEAGRVVGREGPGPR